MGKYSRIKVKIKYIHMICMYIFQKETSRDKQTDAHNRQNIANQRPEYINHT